MRAAQSLQKNSGTSPMPLLTFAQGLCLYCLQFAFGRVKANICGIFPVRHRNTLLAVVPEK